MQQAAADAIQKRSAEAARSLAQTQQQLNQAKQQHVWTQKQLADGKGGKGGGGKKWNDSTNWQQHETEGWVSNKRMKFLNFKDKKAGKSGGRGPY